VDKSILVWEKGSFEVVRMLMGHKGNVQRVCVNDRYLLSVSVDLSAILWDKTRCDPLYRITKAHTKAINGAVFWGDVFLTYSQAEGRARVWGIKTGRLNKELGLCISEAGGVLVDQDKVYVALKRPPGIKMFSTREIFED
jgi:WD40 repeat protein